MVNQELLKQAFTVLARTLIVWLLGATAAHSPALHDFIDSYVTNHGGLAVVAVSIGAALLISAQAIYTRMRARYFAKVALTAAPGTPLQAVDDKVKEASTVAILTADPTK